MGGRRPAHAVACRHGHGATCTIYTHANCILPLVQPLPPPPFPSSPASLPLRAPRPPSSTHTHTHARAHTHSGAGAPKPQRLYVDGQGPHRAAGEPAHAVRQHRLPPDADGRFSHAGRPLRAARRRRRDWDSWRVAGSGAGSCSLRCCASSRRRGQTDPSWAYTYLTVHSALSTRAAFKLMRTAQSTAVPLQLPRVNGFIVSVVLRNAAKPCAKDDRPTSVPLDRPRPRPVLIKYKRERKPLTVHRCVDDSS